jgi:tetratricopeptide (TPR) repeat protein
VFFDQSKNNSGTRFATAACANALNLRAYRERRKAARFSDLSLRYLYLERTPAGATERAAYLRRLEIAEAIDEARADLAAAPGDHPNRAEHRHLLAYALTKAGRYAEAVQEFQAVDGYAGAWPWQLHTDPAASFAATRAEALLGWQRATDGR